MCQINQGDSRALLCTNFSSPPFFYTEFKNIEWCVVITINYSYYHYWSSYYSSPLGFYYLNMAWLCRVTVFWLFWNLSAGKCTPTETNNSMTDFWILDLFFYQEECALCRAQNKPVFSLGEALRHLLVILLKRERCTDEREKIYICKEVTVLFVQHGFEIFETFQKAESHVSYLPAHLQWYVFDFEIELKILIFKWMSSIPTGEHICTVQNQKTTLRKKT